MRSLLGLNDCLDVLVFDLRLFGRPDQSAIFESILNEGLVVSRLVIDEFMELPQEAAL